MDVSSLGLAVLLESSGDIVWAGGLVLSICSKPLRCQVNSRQGEEKMDSFSSLSPHWKCEDSKPSPGSIVCSNGSVIVMENVVWNHMNVSITMVGSEGYD